MPKRKRTESGVDMDCILNVDQFEDVIPTVNQLRESVLRFGGTVIHIQKWLTAEALPSFFITFATAAQARHVVESMGNRIRWVDNREVWHWGAIQKMVASSLRYYRLPELLRRVDLTSKSNAIPGKAPKPLPSVTSPALHDPDKEISAAENVTAISRAKRRRRSTASISWDREASRQTTPNAPAVALSKIGTIHSTPPHATDIMAPSDPSLPLSESSAEPSASNKLGLEPGTGPGPPPRLEPELSSGQSLGPGGRIDNLPLRSFSHIMESCESQLAAAAAETRYWRDQAEHWKQQRELPHSHLVPDEAMWRERVEEWEACYKRLRDEFEMERQAAEDALDRARYFALQQRYNAEMEREGRLILEDLYVRRFWGPALR